MELARLDLNLLLVFHHLLREKRVSAVATVLGMSQPAVSSALSRLRASLGDTLFLRTQGGMAPTPYALQLAEPVAAAAVAAVEVEQAPRSGADVFNEACAACHVAGVAGAPRLGDTAAWTDRIAKGRDTLVEHAIKGFAGSAGYMPAKGGRMDLSDADTAAAVEYMMEKGQ